MTNHFVASGAVQISKNLWDGMSEKEKSLVADFQARSLTVTTPDLAPFRASMAEYYKQLEAEFGAGSIAKVIGN